MPPSKTFAAPVQYLKQSSKKVAVGGFCLGGALTMLAARRVPEMDAGACFYGLLRNSQLPSCRRSRFL